MSFSFNFINIAKFLQPTCVDVIPVMGEAAPAAPGSFNLAPVMGFVKGASHTYTPGNTGYSQISGAQTFYVFNSESAALNHDWSQMSRVQACVYNAPYIG